TWPWADASRAVFTAPSLRSSSFRPTATSPLQSIFATSTRRRSSAGGDSIRAACSAGASRHSRSFAHDRHRRASRGERPHFGIEIGLALEANAGQIGHRDVALLHVDAVRKAAIGLEQVGVALV